MQTTHKCILRETHLQQPNRLLCACAAGCCRLMVGSVPRPRPAPRSGATSSGAAAPAPAPPTTRTKLVVRRLPPTLTQEAFLAELAAKLGCAEAEPQCGGHLAWFRYVPGRPGPKRPCPSLAYLAVRTETQLQEVVAAVLSLAFVSDKGASYTPCVEFAPYQRVPKAPSGRKDVREGTLDKEAEYLAFVEALSAPAPPKPSAESVAAGADAKKVLMGAGSEVYETPLMAFMKARSEARAKQRSAGKASRKAAAGKGDAAAAAAPQRTKKSGGKSGDRAATAGERGKHKQSGGGARPEGKGPSTSVVINPSNAGVVSSGSSYAAAAAAASGGGGGGGGSAAPAPRVLARPLSGGNLSGQAQGPPPSRGEGKQLPAPKPAAGGVEIFYGSGNAPAEGAGQGKGGRPHGKGRSGGRGGRGGGGGGGGGGTT